MRIPEFCGVAEFRRSLLITGKRLMKSWQSLTPAASMREI